MLTRDDLPELSTNLISALASLDMYDLTHFRFQISEYLTLISQPLNTTLAAKVVFKRLTNLSTETII
jgi:hypothetical protein